MGSTHKATLQQGTPLAYPLHHICEAFLGPLHGLPKQEIKMV